MPVTGRHCLGQPSLLLQNSVTKVASLIKIFTLFAFLVHLYGVKSKQFTLRTIIWTRCRCYCVTTATTRFASSYSAGTTVCCGPIHWGPVVSCSTVVNAVLTRLAFLNRFLVVIHASCKLLSSAAYLINNVQRFLYQSVLQAYIHVFLLQCLQSTLCTPVFIFTFICSSFC